MAIKYRSRAAAQRAVSRISRDVPQVHVEINFDNTLTVYAYRSALSPADLARLEGHEVKEPPAPDPSTPLLRPVKPRGCHARKNPPSTVKNPAKVCRDLLNKWHEEGRLDERTEALKALVALGVNPNTAKVYYAKVRGEKGLDKSIRRARARSRSPASLRPFFKPTAAKVCNGIQEPALGTKSREVWDMADVVYRRLGRTPKRGEVAAHLPGVTAELMKSAFPRWRKFHGLTSAGQYHNRRRK